MRYVYREACSEVCFILNNLEDNSLKRIPDKIINLLEKNKIKHYPINIDLSIPLNNQVLKEETKAILALLYRKFLCSDSERIILEEEFKTKLQKEKEIERLNIKVDTKNNDLSSCSTKVLASYQDNKIQNTKQELPLIQEKNSIFKVFLIKIKKILHIN